MGSNPKNGGRLFLLTLSVVALLVCVAALSNPYWIRKKFSVPVPTGPAGLAHIQVSVESDIGMYYGCTEKKASLIGLDEYECESFLEKEEEELIEDWQWIAGGLGLASVIIAFLATVLSLWVACREKCLRALSATITAMHFIAFILMGAAVLLFHENREDKLVNSQLDLRIPYDLNWGFWVGVTSTGLFFLLGFFNFLASCRNCSSGQRA